MALSLVGRGLIFEEGLLVTLREEVTAMNSLILKVDMEKSRTKKVRVRAVTSAKLTIQMGGFSFSSGLIFSSSSMIDY